MKIGTILAASALLLGLSLGLAGGGGAGLYGPGLDKTKDALKEKFAANYADFTAKMVADQHSFTVLDCAPTRLELRAINVKGDELDRVIIHKK